MFTVKNAVFENPQMVIKTLTKVYNYDGYGNKESAKVMRLCDIISVKMNDYLSELKALQESDDKEGLAEKVKTLQEKEVEFNANPFSDEVFEKVSFSPADLKIVKPFFNASVFADL